MNGIPDRKSEESLVEPLTAREIEILGLIADNLTKREIAQELSLAYGTVKWYTQQIYQKLTVHGRRQAVWRARELGYLRYIETETIFNGTEPAVEVTNPYKGLRAFQEADADDFFGREALIDKLLARLKEDGQEAHFLAVVGPSGCGKSSLVKAGLIPALRHGALPDSRQWTITEMVPGKQPFEALESSLLRVSENPNLSLKERFQEDTRGILQAVRLVLPSDNDDLLLVIDQFEEIFTLVKDKTKAIHFLKSMCTAITHPHSQVRVVITLRADFFDRLLLDPDLSRLVQDRTELVLPLTVDEMEQAIREPAERAGLVMESGLVAAIVADMVENPGALPLLQYTLTEIFDHRTGRRLNYEPYQSMGELQGILDRRAEACYAGLSPEGKIAARQLFLRLVTLGEGINAAGLPVPNTRRQVLRSELEAMTGESLIASPDSSSQEIDPLDAITAALDHFGRARLLFFDRDALTRRPTVEIAHEALLSEWKRLHDWLEAGRKDVRMQRTLAHAAAEWSRAAYDTSFLMHGTRLSLFGDWAQETDLALTSKEKLYLEASLAERRARQSVEAARKEHTASLERRAQSFELALMAINNLEIDPERSILLALQAVRTADTREAMDALHRSIQSSRLRRTLTGYQGGANSVHFSPDGRSLATAGFSGEVTLWDVKRWEKLFSLPGIIVRYSPDGRRLATASQDGLITIWDPTTQTRLLAVESHYKINELRFSPDGKILVSTCDDFTFAARDAETGQRLFSSTAAYYASFSPDGRFLITEDDSESVINLWDVDDDWALLDQLQGFSVPVFSPDGRWFVTRAGTLENGIALWDLSDVDLGCVNLSALEPHIISSAHDVNIIYFTFSPDGSLLVSCSIDGVVKVWEFSNGGLEPLMVLYGHHEYVFDASFSPDNSRLATAGWDGTVRVWDLTPAGASEWFAFKGHMNNIYRLALTRDGKYLATASVDGSAKIWNLETEREADAITGHGGELLGVDIHPQGSLLATAGRDDAAKIWELDIEAGKHAVDPLHSLAGQAVGSPVGGLFPGLTPIVFSPDGVWLATGGRDGMARIWHVKNSRKLLSIQAHPDRRGVTNLAFSPDGRLLATTSAGPQPLAKIWDTASGAEISSFRGHRQTKQIWSLAFGPEGGRAATGDRMGGLHIWDVKTGQQLLNLPGHISTVFGLDFSPDGTYLASASQDGTARVWDTISGEAIQVFTCPSGCLFDVAFTPDGKRLIVSGEGYIYGYLFDQDELVRLAESRCTRDLTPQERRLFLHQDE